MKNQDIVSEYLARFDFPKNSFDKFFTQHSGKDFVENLPFIPNIEKFCVRLASALEKKEKICIYADYDTDAVTATACMFWGLIYLGFEEKNLSFYAPDRFIEGYGVNSEAIEKLAKENDLIITVDCGINSVEEAKIVKSLGKDILITDHHSLTGQIPPADAVINPRLNEYYLNPQKELPDKIQDCQFQDFLDRFYQVQEQKFSSRFQPNSQTHLSSSVVGAGVSWFAVLWLAYFLQFQKLVPESFNIKILNKTLPFAAIGTIADLQSIKEPTNRLLVKAGLQILNTGKTGFLGLDLLNQNLGFTEKIDQGYVVTSQDLAFYHSPILNSSGRISHAKLSISLMLTDDKNLASQKAGELIKTNDARKKMVADILQEVDGQAEEQFLKAQSLIFLEGAWNKGIVGLLASRLVNKYNLPVVVVFVDEESVGGSARAPEGYNLPEAFSQVKEFFKKFGGHPGAAGFEMLGRETQNLKSSLEKVFLQQSQNFEAGSLTFQPKDWQIPSFLANEFFNSENIWLEARDLDNDLYKSVFNLGPFGRDFPMPELVFEIQNYQVKWLGQDAKHIKVFFDNKIVTIFNLEKQAKKFFEKGQGAFWVKAKLSQNTWNSKTSLELLANKVWV